MSYQRNEEKPAVMITSGLAPAETQTDIQEYLQRFLRWKWLGVFVFIIVFGLVTLLILRTPPVYEGRGTMMATGKEDKAFTQITYLLPPAPKIANYVELLRSQRLAEMVVKRLPDSIIKKIEFYYPNASITSTLRSMINARGVKETDIIQISASARDKGIACAVVNAYLDAFVQYDMEKSRVDVTAVREFIENQFAAVKTRLDSLERELEYFKSTNRLVDINEETKNLIDRQSAIAAAYEQAATEAAASQARLNHIRNLIEEEGKGLADRLENISSPLVANLKTTLNQLEVQKTNLLIQGFAETSNEVKNLERQIDSVRNRLRLESQVLIAQQGFTDPLGRLSNLFESALTLETEIATNRAKQEALRQALQKYDATLARMPAAERALAQITRDVETGRKVYAYLSERAEEARIQEIGRIPSVRIIDYAQGASKTRPNVRTGIVFALFFAVVAAFGSVWLADRLDVSVRSPEDMERHGFTVLAAIPDLRKVGRRRKRIILPDFASLFSRFRLGRRYRRHRYHRKSYDDITQHLITHADSESSGAEAFRLLRTSLAFSGVDRPLRTIAVTSTLPGEGKSTVAVNLAAVMAQAGSRVLLIDADIRYPLLHRLFGQPRKPGFTDLIVQGKSTDGFVFGTRIERLSWLPAGTTPPSPADLFVSPATSGLIDRLSREYDYVILDTAPVMIASDTPVLSSLVDATIIVVMAGKTPVQAVNAAKALIQNSGGKIAGFVLNMVNPASGGYGRYYYHYYYKYRYYQRGPDTQPGSGSQSGIPEQGQR
ncbi:MAG: polysaccharide biosynthesis tyrosine autokinase [candidate division WOR-3 bacterium]